MHEAAPLPIWKKFALEYKPPVKYRKFFYGDVRNLIAMKSASLRVQEILGSKYKVVEFDASTRTVREAAMVLECKEGQIAKSLVFSSESLRPILVIACGDNQIDINKVAALVGEKIALADAAFVREQTGYAIGGVAPIGHRIAIPILLDQEINKFDKIWAAAGTPNSVFQLTPADLKILTDSRFYDVCCDK